MTDLSFGVPPIRPQVTLQASNASALQARLDKLLRFLSGITPPKDSKLTVSFLYSRPDCSVAVDRALFDATRKAVAMTHGPIRYLQERVTQTGYACAFEPNESDTPVQSSRIVTGAAIGDVIAGY